MSEAVCAPCQHSCRKACFISLADVGVAFFGEGARERRSLWIWHLWITARSSTSPECLADVLPPSTTQRIDSSMRNPRSRSPATKRCTPESSPSSPAIFAEGHLRFHLSRYQEFHHDGLSATSRPCHHQRRKLEFLQRPMTGIPRVSYSSGSPGDGWPHSYSCLETFQGFAEGFVQLDSSSCRQPRSDSALAQDRGSSRGRLRSVEARPPHPTSNGSRSRHLDSTTTEAQLAIRAPPVVMSSLLLVLALRPRDLLGIRSQEFVKSCQSLLVYPFR